MTSLSKLPTFMPVYLRNIKSIVAIFFVLLMIFLQPLMVWKLKQNLREVKWAMKIELLKKSSSDLHEVFYFTDEEWKSLPHPDPHEFVLNGLYYDVFQKDFQDGKWMVKCVRDDREGEIKRELKTWMAEDNSPYQEKKQQGNVFPVVKKMICELPSGLNHVVFLYEENHSYSYREGLRSAHTRACFQPPC